MNRANQSQYVFRLDAHRPLPTAGNKARNLQRLLQQGIPIPTTYVVSWEAYDAYLKDKVDIIEKLRLQIAAVTDPARSYAIRSSANVEDSFEHSFAGQFNTVLNAQGGANIMQAIWSIWATAQSANVQTYLQSLPDDRRDLRMGIIIQEMVTPLVAGVSFSRNPLSGADEIIVEAVEGSGTALVQDGATPLRWVYAAKRWQTAPAESPVSRSVIEDVVAQTRTIADLFAMNVDLEWVYDGQQVTWVQLREITALRNLTVYSNRIAKEVLPGLIKPLIWSTNIPLVNNVWIDLLTELIGPNDLHVDDLARRFHYRAYFNVSALGRIWDALGLPPESLEIVMGVAPQPEEPRRFRPSRRIIRLLPRLLRFAGQHWRLGPRFAREYPTLRAAIDAFSWANAPAMEEATLLAEIDRLAAELRPIVSYNVTIPILLRLYDLLLGGVLRRAGVDPARFDTMAGMDEHRDYAPEHALGALQTAAARLDPALREQIGRMSYAQFQQLPAIPELQEQVARFLARYGHLSDSGNDFSATPWREQPELVLQLLVEEPPPAGQGATMVRLSDVRLPPFTGRWARLLYRRTRQFRLYREQISSLYTLGYGLFRPYYLALGARFRERGLLTHESDIFFLSRDEIDAVVFPGKGAAPAPQAHDFATLATARQAEMARCSDLQLPTLVYGDVAPLIDTTHERLSGVATSRGCYSGPVRVVRGLLDFGRVQPGDVLVIPFSDVGWTPLFAHAGAIVAESGGMLSHSSIVAREYQIPAVVSVPGAMRLRDDMRVTVDGFRGEVRVHAPEPERE